MLTHLRMARVITSLHMPPGSQWLFRLDQINTPAGRIADRHQHPGPGIRCLLEGSFNVQQDAESVRDVAPGDAWWETGSDTVIAWGSRADGDALPARHGPAGGMRGQSPAPGSRAAVRRQGQLEALCRLRDHALKIAAAINLDRGDCRVLAAFPRFTR